MANFIERLFKKKKEPQRTETVQVTAGGPAYFTPFSGNAYESDIYRAAVDSIARNTAKLKGGHVVILDGQRKEGDPALNKILQIRPNYLMTAYDLFYKITTHYFLYNNAFAYLDKDDKGNLKAIWPIRPLGMEYVTDPAGALYGKFIFADGKTYILPFSDIFHIRRHFNDNDLLGDTNTAILPTLELAHTQNEGMEQTIKSGATIRGILKYNQVLSPEKLKEEKNAFINDYLSVANNGGIVAVDTKADYTSLETNPATIDDKQLNAIKNKIYEYLGISENIVNSSYNEDEWGAFYESVIEPLALQFGLELTSKIFTPREQAFGNSILFEANRLQFASTKTKNELIFKLLPMGILSINEAREILNLAAIEDGDEYIQSLNYVNKDIIDKYQLGGKENEGN